MRKTLLGLMAFLVLTPSLVCAMVFCPMPSAQAGEQASCHENNADYEDSGVMLMSDCMGVDFFMQDIVYDFEVDHQVHVSGLLWGELASGYNFELQNINGVRGPPPQGIAESLPQPLYLITQRVRI